MPISGTFSISSNNNDVRKTKCDKSKSKHSSEKSKKKRKANSDFHTEKSLNDDLNYDNFEDELHTSKIKRNDSPVNKISLESTLLEKNDAHKEKTVIKTENISFNESMTDTPKKHKKKKIRYSNTLGIENMDSVNSENTPMKCEQTDNEMYKVSTPDVKAEKSHFDESQFGNNSPKKCKNKKSTNSNSNLSESQIQESELQETSTNSKHTHTYQKTR